MRFRHRPCAGAGSPTWLAHRGGCIRLHWWSAPQGSPTGSARSPAGVDRDHRGCRLPALAPTASDGSRRNAPMMSAAPFAAGQIALPRSRAGRKCTKVGDGAFGHLRKTPFISPIGLQRRVRSSPGLRRTKCKLCQSQHSDVTGSTWRSLQRTACTTDVEAEITCLNSYRQSQAQKHSGHQCRSHRGSPLRATSLADVRRGEHP
jgi:hypothetical protein